MSGGRVEHEHDWVVVVEDIKRSERGLQVCDACDLTLERIHPLLPAGADADAIELYHGYARMLDDFRDQLVGNDLVFPFRSS